jgi:TolB-like protein
MKTAYLYSILFLAIILNVTCVSAGKANVMEDNKVEDEVNALVLQVSDYLAERLPPNTPVSLMNISENELDTANFIVERVSSELVNSNKLVVVARKSLEPIQMEQDFQLANASEESLVGIGKFLGAQAVITCSIAWQNEKTRFYVKALDVETGQIRADKSYELISLSSDNVVKGLLQVSLPAIKKINSQVPEFIYEPIPDNELWGVGVANITESYESAMDRAIASITQQILYFAQKELYMEIDLDWVSYYHQFLPTMALSVSRYATINQRAQTNDGKIWYRASLKKIHADELVMEMDNVIKSSWIK